MIRLENICKRFNSNVEALKDVSLTINDGEVFGIIGYSGAGKSTLIRCINLLEKPTSGKVFVGQTEVTSLAGRELRKFRLGIGMIFQLFNLMSSRTVFQNVALPLEGILPRAEIKKRVHELLATVELDGRENSYPSQLSGGQKQRVAIARALASNPKILLCDEATSALDPETTQSILQLLKKLNRERGLTIVVVTHEMDVIKDICNRVAVMENGRLVEEGFVYDIFATPRDQITKKFVRTTSNLSKIYGLVAEDSPITRIKSGEKIVSLQYQKADVSSPLLSEMTEKFHVKFNILFSDLELIGGVPIGGTVSVVSGKSEDIEKALRYVKEQGVKVEVVKE